MRKAYFLIFLFLSAIFNAQNDSVFHLAAEIPDYSSQIEPLHGWKYHRGNDMRWADPLLDDSKWQHLSSSFNLGIIPENTFENIGWFRLHIEVDTLLVDKTLGLLLTQSGASEIYLDGKLLYSFGKINTKDPAKEERYSPHSLPVDIRFEKIRNHIIAVRYADARAIGDFKDDANNNTGFAIRIAKLREAIEWNYLNSNTLTAVFIFYFAFFFAISFLHFMMYLYYKTNKSNLYYSVFALSFGFTFVWLLVQQNFLYPDTISTFRTIGAYLSDIYAPALLAMLYTIFYKKILKIFWLWMAIYIIDVVTSIFNIDIPYLGWTGLIIFVFESLRIMIVSIYKKKEGAWMIGTGVITTLIFFTTYTIIASLTGDINFNQTGWLGFLIGVAVILATLSIPLSMTIYLARDFAKTSKNLEKKLVEVEELSAKAIAQEKEKQKYLENQKQVLEEQVVERTLEITSQKKIIEEKNKDIIDSINYAKRIQSTIIPTEENFKAIFPKSFVFYEPRDIVSGDFYYLEELPHCKLLFCADCTGHGVPGALMSMVGSNLLHKIIHEQHITNPKLILEKLHHELRNSLKQDIKGSTNRDGMDACIVALTDTQLIYSGANRPFIYFDENNQLQEIKSTKTPIGGSHIEHVNIDEHILDRKSVNHFYVFSDGFADQFGGPNGKKLMVSQFKAWLQTISSLKPEDKVCFLSTEFKKWKMDLEQVDDVMVIGVTPNE